MKHTISNISEELFFYMQINLGLTLPEIIQLRKAGKLKDVEKATTVIADALKWKCPKLN